MKSMLNAKRIGNFLLIVLAIMTLFHALVLFGIFLPEVIWDTTITDTTSLITAECIAFCLMALFMVGVAAKMRYIRIHLFIRLSKSIIWVMFVYFALNAAGYLFSALIYHKVVFAPFMLLLALASARFVLEPDKTFRPKRKKADRRMSL